MNQKQMMHQRIAELGGFMVLHHGMNPGEAGVAVRELLAAERKLHRLAEHSCNGTMKTERIERLEENTLRKIAKAYPGLELYYQTDPRGCALYVGRSNEELTGDNYNAAGVAFCA